MFPSSINALRMPLTNLFQLKSSKPCRLKQLMMLRFLMSTPVSMMAIVEKEIFVATIRSKSYGGYTETWESAFEPIPPRERTCIPPLLSARQPLAVPGSFSSSKALTSVPMDHLLAFLKLVRAYGCRSRSGWVVAVVPCCDTS